MSDIWGNVGELSQRIDVYEPLEKGAPGGGIDRCWNKKMTVWGGVRPLTGRERVASDRIEATAGYHFLLRARDDIFENDSLVWRNRRYNIRWVKNRKPRSLYVEVETDIGVAV